MYVAENLPKQYSEREAREAGEVVLLEEFVVVQSTPYIGSNLYFLSPSGANLRFSNPLDYNGAVGWDRLQKINNSSGISQEYEGTALHIYCSVWFKKPAGQLTGNGIAYRAKSDDVFP